MKIRSRDCEEQKHLEFKEQKSIWKIIERVIQCVESVLTYRLWVFFLTDLFE